MPRPARLPAAGPPAGEPGGAAAHHGLGHEPLGQVMMVSLAVTARHPILHFASLAPALIPVLVLLLGLDVYCLVNLARAKSVRNAPKLAWVIVILCVSAPLGAILYLFFGMDRTGAGQRKPPARSQASSSSAPPPTAGSA